MCSVDEMGGCVQPLNNELDLPDDSRPVEKGISHINDELNTEATIQGIDSGITENNTIEGAAQTTNDKNTEAVNNEAAIKPALIPTPTLLLLEKTRLMLKGRRNRRRTWMMCRVIEAAKKNPKKTLKELGREFGVTHVTIYRYLRELGFRKSLRMRGCVDDEYEAGLMKLSNRKGSLRQTKQSNKPSVDDDSSSEEPSDCDDPTDQDFNPDAELALETDELVEEDQVFPGIEANWDVGSDNSNFDADLEAMINGDAEAENTEQDAEDEEDEDADDLFLRCNNTNCMKAPIVIRLARLVCPELIKPSKLARHPEKKIIRLNKPDSDDNKRNKSKSARKPASFLAELVKTAEPIIDRIPKPGALVNWHMKDKSMNDLAQRLADQKGLVLEPCPYLDRPKPKIAIAPETSHSEVLKMDEDSWTENSEPQLPPPPRKSIFKSRAAATVKKATSSRVPVPPSPGTNSSVERENRPTDTHVGREHQRTDTSTPALRGRRRIGANVPSIRAPKSAGVPTPTPRVPLPAAAPVSDVRAPRPIAAPAVRAPRIPKKPGHRPVWTPVWGVRDTELAGAAGFTGPVHASPPRVQGPRVVGTLISGSYPPRFAGASVHQPHSMSNPFPTTMAPQTTITPLPVYPTSLPATPISLSVINSVPTNCNSASAVLKPESSMESSGTQPADLSVAQLDTVSATCNPEPVASPINDVPVAKAEGSGTTVTTPVQIGQPEGLINNFLPMATPVNLWCGPMTNGVSTEVIQPTSSYIVNPTTTCLNPTNPSLFPANYAISLGPNTVFIPFIPMAAPTSTTPTAMPEFKPQTN